MSNRWLLNFFWNDTYWVKKFLFFELSTFFMLFDFFVKKFRWILFVKEWKKLLQYLNNFFTILKNHQKRTRFESFFQMICIFFELKNHLNKKLTNIFNELMKMELNFVKIKVRLSFKKHAWIVQKINAILRKIYMTMKQLQDLIRFFVFVNKIIISERNLFSKILQCNSKKFTNTSTFFRRNWRESKIMMRRFITMKRNMIVIKMIVK